MKAIEIYTVVAAVVAVYLVGVWLTFLGCGLMSFNRECDEEHWVMSLMWPFSVPLFLTACLTCWLSDLWYRRTSARARELVLRVVSWVTLPLRPFRIGVMLRRKG